MALQWHHIGKYAIMIQNDLNIGKTIDYLKKGLDTPPLGVWNLGPSMKKGVYFKNSL